MGAKRWDVCQNSGPLPRRSSTKEKSKSKKNNSPGQLPGHGNAGSVPTGGFRHRAAGRHCDYYSMSSWRCASLVDDGVFFFSRRFFFWSFRSNKKERRRQIKKEKKLSLFLFARASKRLFLIDLRGTARESTLVARRTRGSLQKKKRKGRRALAKRKKVGQRLAAGRRTEGNCSELPLLFSLTRFFFIRFFLSPFLLLSLSPSWKQKKNMLCSHCLHYGIKRIRFSFLFLLLLKEEEDWI